MSDLNYDPDSAEIDFIPDGDYITEGGIEVIRMAGKDDFKTALDTCLNELDSQRGVVLSSNYEYPGRYTRWELGSSTHRCASPRAAHHDHRSAQ